MFNYIRLTILHVIIFFLKKIIPFKKKILPLVCNICDNFSIELCKDIIVTAQTSLCQCAFYWSFALHDLLLCFFAQSKLYKSLPHFKKLATTQHNLV